MSLLTKFTPSRSTLIWLAVSAAAASLMCFWLLSADADCGSQDWSCRTLAGIGIVSVMAGVECALIFTALVVLLGRLIQVVAPQARTLEPASKAIKIAFMLTVFYILIFGAMSAIGLLPVGTTWWLGVFGLFSPQPQGPVIYVPRP